MNSPACSALEKHEAFLIQELDGLLKAEQSNVLDKFYSDLLSEKNLKDSLLPKDTIEQFSLFQKSYFDHLINAIGQEPTESLQKWLNFTRLGLTPLWHIQAFTQYLSILTDALKETLSNNPEKFAELIVALQKHVFCNMHLVADAIFNDSPNQLAILLDQKTFLEHLQREITNRPSDKLVALILIDLAYISEIDGIWGYQAGNLLLQQIITRLRNALREKDILGNISRSELGCILPAIPSEGHTILAAHKILRTLESPFTIAGQQVYINPNLGISLYPQYSKDAESLMKQANVAMHEAKRSQEPFIIYDTNHEKIRHLNFEIQSDLRKALENNELNLYYQPQLDLKTGRLVSSEALLRWHNGKEFVPAMQIITVAEQTGLITPLTSWVFNAAIRQCAALERAGFDLGVSINLSTKNLDEPELPEFIEQALDTWQAPPEKIMIEITESAMMADQQKAREALLKLKDLGVRLAIDDFGTGYSSMSYLQGLPIDELKIDQSFIKNLVHTKGDQRIVSSVIDLAHNLGLTVVAEGVEDEQTMNYLRDQGCDRAQGLFISPPLSDEALRKTISTFRQPTPGLP